MTTPTTNDGLVIVDKPAGWTSHDVVGRVRRLAGTRRVGHAGTLDPMATGVLVLGIGRATRLLGHLQLADKEYDASIRLGESTVTDDAEGDVIESADASHLTLDVVRAAMLPLTGDIQQVPTAVSAIKVDGKRSYARVRAGEDVELQARPVTISVFEAHHARHVGHTFDVDVHVACSTGTYVRALARDLGRALGVGGHLTMLRRTRVGGFAASDARTLDELEAEFALVPIAQAARSSFATLDVDDVTAQDIRFGRKLPGFDLGQLGPVALFAGTGEFLALYEQRDDVARPVAVFV
jgi:tRNA pseudouridine55 synthase